MIGFNVKRVFFDTKTVRSKTDKATRRVLSKFGAFVRQTAKRSMRKRKKTSQPGKPPSSHTGLLKKFIFFGYDVVRRSVVIGPVRLTRKGRGEAPSVLEYGGAVTMRSLRRAGKKRRARIRPRPFMGPAMEKEKDQLPALWRDSAK
ncbi:MAG: hypothetical protein JRJ72_13115 [Deltaproteobacteria bacterium]|nr:hypothetical protein [Deltaproteobacteria bacterium]